MPPVHAARANWITDHPTDALIETRNPHHRHHPARRASVPMVDPHAHRAHAADPAADGRGRLRVRRSDGHRAIRRSRALSARRPVGAGAARASGGAAYALSFAHPQQEPRGLRLPARRRQQALGRAALRQRLSRHRRVRRSQRRRQYRGTAQAREEARRLYLRRAVVLRKPAAHRRALRQDGQGADRSRRCQLHHDQGRRRAV